MVSIPGYHAGTWVQIPIGEDILALPSIIVTTAVRRDVNKSEKFCVSHSNHTKRVMVQNLNPF